MIEEEKVMFDKFKGVEVIDDKNNKSFHIGVDKELNLYPKILLVNKKDPLGNTSYIEILKDDDTRLFFDFFDKKSKNNFTIENIKSILEILQFETIDIYLYNYTDKKYTEYHNFYLEVTPPQLRSNFDLFNDSEDRLKQIIDSKFKIHNIYEFDFNNKNFKKRDKDNK